MDDVSVTRGELSRWHKVLAPYSVLYVGLKASLDALEKREAERGDRMLGSARLFFQKVKFGKHYDLELDTSVQSVHQCVQLILEKVI